MMPSSVPHRAVDVVVQCHRPAELGGENIPQRHVDPMKVRGLQNHAPRDVDRPGRRHADRRHLVQRDTRGLAGLLDAGTDVGDHRVAALVGLGLGMGPPDDGVVAVNDPELEIRRGQIDPDDR